MSSPATNSADVTCLRCQLIASQVVVAELRSNKCKRRWGTDLYTVHLIIAIHWILCSNDNNAGHGLTRLISIFDTIWMLTDKANHQLTSELEELDGIPREKDVSGEIVHEYVVILSIPLWLLTSFFRHERLFISYSILLNTVTKIKKLLEDPKNEEELKDFTTKVSSQIQVNSLLTSLASFRSPPMSVTEMIFAISIVLCPTLAHLCALVEMILVFKKGYVTLQFLFMVIISLDAFIPKWRNILVILNLYFSKVHFLLRYALSVAILLLLMSCRLIVPFLLLQSLLMPLMQLLRMKMALTAST